MKSSTLDKMENLKKYLLDMKSVLIAYSGGVDSAFLLKVAAEVLGDQVLAVTAESEIHPAFELEGAAELAQNLHVAHETVRSGEMEDETFLKNPPERCYICKKRLFSTLVSMAADRGISHIIDGSNVDDSGDYRPGMKALKELGIRSPLKEAGLTKKEIRELSKSMDLPTWNRPAMACLASRIPYGHQISGEILKRVEKAESALRQLGFEQVRVRDYEKSVRIEVLPDQMSAFLDEELRTLIILKLKTLGYAYITLDLEGYRTGSLNEVL